MRRARSAAGGGRWLEVAPERLAIWLAGFDARHRVTPSVYRHELASFEAADGCVAECHPSFPPLAEAARHEGLEAGPLLAQCLPGARGRRGARAAGRPRGRRLRGRAARALEGRLAAGARAARRRRLVAAALRPAAGGPGQDCGQAAADAAADVLVPALPTLDAVVLGGDRRAVARLRDDVRLSGVIALAADRFLAAPEPRLAVLRAAPVQFRSVRVRLLSPPS